VPRRRNEIQITELCKGHKIWLLLYCMYSIYIADEIVMNNTVSVNTCEQHNTEDTNYALTHFKNCYQCLGYSVVSTNVHIRKRVQNTHKKCR